MGVCSCQAAMNLFLAIGTWSWKRYGNNPNVLIGSSFTVEFRFSVCFLIYGIMYKVGQSGLRTVHKFLAKAPWNFLS